MNPTHKAPLTASDVYIQAALVAGSGWMGVAQIASAYDYFARSPISFDTLSFGAARLVANGLAEARNANGAFELRAVESGLTGNPPGVGAIDFAFQLAEALGVRMVSDPGDQVSIGRVSGLTYTQYADAVAPTQKWKGIVDARLPGARLRPAERPKG
jgi:hypothetical protein